MKRLALACALISLSPSLARAHGGLPITQKILRQNGGDTMYVPVVFWGVWVGAPGQPWHWICEEEINNYRGRHIQLSTDGTFYATDTRGMQVSTDRGCTWTSIASSEPAALKLNDVAVDPVDGATAYVVSGDSGSFDGDGAVTPAANALFITHDHGQSFTRAPGLAALSSRQFQSVKLSPNDAKKIYVTSTNGQLPFAPSVHYSTDGGMTFSAQPLAFTIGGQAPYTVDVLAIDPRDPTVVYVRVQIAGLDSDGGPITHQALLRSIDAGASFAAIYQLDAVPSPSGLSRGIDGVAIDAPRARVLVASAAGLFAADDAGRAPSITLQPSSSLSQAQCVDVHNGTVFACSTNYTPDFKAIAASSDGAQTFSKILQFVDTVGPVNCPAGTPVGDQCPFYWQTYGSQLGITVDDAGTDGGKPPPGGAGCGGGCGVASRGAGALGGGLLLGLFLLAWIARRRAS
jgi:hypothetical protein